MSRPKLKHVVLLICVAVIALGMVAMANGYVRPKNPTMDYVPQNVGVYDTYYQNFKESDCRWCHGASTADKHHNTWNALIGNCTFCHPSPGIPPERDCKVCHVDGGAVGNYGFPHHRSDLADSGQCQACHNPNVVREVNSIEPPQYIPTITTPTPYSCENCHWPSGSVPHEAATEDGNAGKFLNDWNTWTGYPIPSHWPNSLSHPAPIEANGPMFSGVLFAGGPNLQKPIPWAMPAKPFQPMDGTHHEIAGKVYPKCFDCHGTNPDTDPSWDPTNVYLIRMCENCHDIGTLHVGISEHTDNPADPGYGGPYRIGNKLAAGLPTNPATPATDMVANTKCVACHGDGMPPAPVAPTLPNLPIMRPWIGPAGMLVDVIPLCGDTAGSIDCTSAAVPYHLGDFGQDTPCNYVDMKQTAPAAGAFLSTNLYAWTENLVRFRVPGWSFTPGAGDPIVYGVAKVRVNQIANVSNPSCTGNTISVFANGKTMANLDFFVRKTPEINSIAPDAGWWGTTITVNGVGFWENQEWIYPKQEAMTFSGGTGSKCDGYPANDCDLSCDAGEPCVIYGYSTYAELVASNDKYRFGKYGVTWKDNQISLKLQSGTLWDVNTNNPVPDSDLTVGDWQIQVVTDYWKRSTDSVTVDGAHLLASGKLQPGDEIIMRDVGPPIKFTVSKNPQIFSVAPNPVPAGNTLKILGINFGVTGVENLGDGVGNDDGICQSGEKCKVALCANTSVWPACTSPKYPTVKVWSDTLIKVKVPAYTAPYPKKKLVQVTVPSAATPTSNFWLVKIKAPGT